MPTSLFLARRESQRGFAPGSRSGLPPQVPAALARPGRVASAVDSDDGPVEGPQRGAGRARLQQGACRCSQPCSSQVGAMVHSCPTHSHQAGNSCSSNPNFGCGYRSDALLLYGGVNWGKPCAGSLSGCDLRACRRRGDGRGRGSRESYREPESVLDEGALKFTV